MTIREIAAAIGGHALLHTDKLSVAVLITDAKLAYGSVRYEVTPRIGSGSVWVDAGRVTLIEE